MKTRASSSSTSSTTSRVALKERGNEAFRAKRFPEVGRDGTERARDGRETDDERSSQAMDAYMRALETCGEDVAVLTNLSATYLELGEYRLAADSARRALEANASWRKGYHRMAVAFERMGEKERALGVYRRGLEICGSNAQIERRAEMLEKALAREAEAPEALKTRGNALLRDGENEMAEEMYTIAIEQGRASRETLVTLHNNRAEARRRAGLFELSIEDCTTVLVMEPMNLKAALRRAGMYEALEKYSHACKDYELALRIDPKDPCRVRQRLNRCRALE